MHWEKGEKWMGKKVQCGVICLSEQNIIINTAM